MRSRIRNRYLATPSDSFKRLKGAGPGAPRSVAPPVSFSRFPVNCQLLTVNFRPAFTLIEILIVLVIILILSGLILGAILQVGKLVSKTQQYSEVTQIEAALNDFKSTHGVFPPSRIRLREWHRTNSQPDDAYSMDDPFDAHSVGYLKRIWPDIKLPIRQTIGSAVLSERPDAGDDIQWFAPDPDPNNWIPMTYELEGDECLVFFLGGIAERLGDASYVLHGFTADPKNPSRIPNTTVPRTLQRNTGTFTFRPGRLYQRSGQFADSWDQVIGQSELMPGGFKVLAAPANLSTNVKLPSYRASSSDEGRPRPIVYFSSYEGRGYRPDDVNIPPIVDDPNERANQTILFQLRWPTLTYPNDVQGGGLPASPVSLGPNPYTESPLSESAPPSGTGVKPTQAFNPKTFQIILPGADGEFGAGGHLGDYDPNTYPPGNPPPWTANEDNIGNFSGGQAIGDFYKELK